MRLKTVELPGANNPKAAVGNFVKVREILARNPARWRDRRWFCSVDVWPYSNSAMQCCCRRSGLNTIESLIAPQMWSHSSSTTKIKMASDTVVRARIDTETKDRATKALSAMGLTVSDFIRMALVRVARDHALPFPVKVPNALTMETLRASDKGNDVHAAKRCR